MEEGRNGGGEEWRRGRNGGGEEWRRGGMEEGDKKGKES